MCPPRELRGDRDTTPPETRRVVPTAPSPCHPLIPNPEPFPIPNDDLASIPQRYSHRYPDKPPMVGGVVAANESCSPPVRNQLTDAHSSSRYPLAAASVPRDTAEPLAPYTWEEKFESFERINSIRETNGNFDSCNSSKRLGTSRLHELHESKFPFVSRIEFIRSKLSNFSAHVYAERMFAGGHHTSAILGIRVDSGVRVEFNQQTFR